MPSTKGKINFILVCLACISCGLVLYFIFGTSSSNIKYSIGDASPQDTIDENKVKSESKDIIPEVKAGVDNTPVTHIKTPSVVKAIYLSSWTAGAQKYRDPLIKLIDNTELNSIVIDVKDSTGRIGFSVADQDLQKMGTTENRISNVRALTNLLHQKNIYIIGRVAVFQDPTLTKLKPEWSITKISDGTVWKDRKGLSFMDPASKDVWKYIVSIAHDAYEEGFDEINFDYIRYPSDGDLNNINYHLVDGKTRADNIEAFFKYLHSEVKKDKDIPMSADLFGLTTEAQDDMGIGQVWEKALPYFDFISPMVYPSHYPPNYNGFKNPADHPYEVINKSISSAVAKTKAQGEDIKKIRPWLQDFNLGAVYTKDLIRAQMKAAADNGINSWMLWDPRNKYTPSALELEVKQ